MPRALRPSAVPLLGALPRQSPEPLSGPPLEVLPGLPLAPGALGGLTARLRRRPVPSDADETQDSATQVTETETEQPDTEQPETESPPSSPRSQRPPQTRSMTARPATSQ